MPSDPHPENQGAGFLQEPSSGIEGLGIGIVGAGLGLQAASLFRLATRVGLGTPADDFLFGLTGVLLIGLGALLFGGLARTASFAGWNLSAFAAGAMGVLALAVVAATTSPLGFKAHCARIGADASLAGTPEVDISAALVMFVLPGFSLGAVLRSRRGWDDFLTVALGFAVGWVARPYLFEAMESVGWKNSGSAGLVLWGAAIVGLGVLLRCLLGGTARTTGFFGGAGLIVGAAFLPVTAIDVYHPWQRFPKKPLRIVETPDGQFTVQPVRLGRGIGQTASLQVLLDQRPISPDAAGLELEAACLQRTVEAYPADIAPWPPSKVLAIGLVTPERAALLASIGIEEFERTAVWWNDMESVEGLVWRDGHPPGESVDPDAIRGRGRYDLVLTFPSGAYRAAGWDLRLVEEANARTKTAWLPWDAPLHHKINGTQLALASSGIEGFAFGLVGGTAEDFGRYYAIEGGFSPEWMETRPEARPKYTLQHLSIHEPALELHTEVQRISSPFETALEGVEINPEALGLWRDRALEPDAVPDGYLRGVLEGAAAVLMAQREIQWIVEYIAPVAERYPDWLGLQAAMAQAESEELNFAAAAERLRPLVDAHPDRTDLVVLLSDALAGLDDPAGRALAQGLLRDDPDNPMLFGLARGVRGMTTMGQPGGYESLTADEAAQLATGRFLGTIEEVSVQEVDPGDGAPLYLTTLLVRGTRLASGVGSTEETVLHEVTFLGGFLDPDHGSFNSTAPPSHQTREGRRILYYYQDQDDIVGGVGGAALLRGRAGLFTAFETQDGAVMVQGRGNAAAIPYNVVSDEL